MSNEEAIPVEEVVVPVTEPEVPAEVVVEPEPADIPEVEPEAPVEPEIETPLSPIEPVGDAEADVQLEPEAKPEVLTTATEESTVVVGDVPFVPEWEELIVDGKHRIEWCVTQTGAFRIRPLSFQGPTYDSDTLAEGLARVPLLY